MATRKTAGRETIPESLTGEVCARLAANRPVRRTLPEKGRVHVDRLLPFLCVYRRRSADHGTSRLVTGEASYLVAPWGARHRRRVSELVRGVVRTMVAEFGAYLVVEVWAAPDGGSAPAAAAMFRVVAPESASLTKTVDVLAQRLARIRVMKRPVEVEVIRQRRISPPDMEPLLGPRETREHNCSHIGLAVPPVYRDPTTGRVFPLLLRGFRRSFGRALRPAFHRFTRSHTTHRPPHYHELGRRAVVKAVWAVDRQLAEISNAFDFLLQATPVNSDDAWREFRRARFERAPEFYYRPTPYDPARLKRRLYEVPVDRLEDPALQLIFHEKQDELDRKITMLGDRDSPRFLYGSLQVYGGVEDELFALATALLQRIPPRSRGESPKGQLDAKAFSARARAEFDRYQAACPEFTATARVTRQVAGLMVSRGALLINPSTKVPLSRVDALLQHEVGTHLVTYFNGRAQPFRQLYCGLAGYEELQEGLAVLAEYLVGGLGRPRMRQLAGRVIAARQLVGGASFVENFRTLRHTHGFSKRNAFAITMRVHRGGGLTKDAVYLRGLQRMLHYLGRGGELDPLFVGKIAIDHMPIIAELRMRRVLRPTPILPLYMREAAALERLARLREGPSSVLALVLRDRRPDSR